MAPGAALLARQGLRRIVYARTKTDVLAKLQELRLEHPGGRDVGDDLTVAVWAEKWLRDIVPNNVRASTLESYERDVRKHVIPEIGHFPLRRLKPSIIANFYRDLATAGTPASTIRSVHLRLHTALEAACDLELISRNPAARLAKLLAKPTESNRKGLDLAETRRFLEAARSDRLYPLYVLALMTGLRQGELFALRWLDVDLDAARLSVRGTLKVVRGKVYVDPPKTKKGRRTMTLPMAAVATLREHRPPTAAEDSWIFQDTDGGPLRRANIAERSFRSILTAAGLPPIKSHELRHTHASLLGWCRA